MSSVDSKCLKNIFEKSLLEGQRMVVISIGRVHCLLMLDALVAMHRFWVADLAFSVNLIGQFLEDVESYSQVSGALHVIRLVVSFQSGVV